MTTPKPKNGLVTKEFGKKSCVHCGKAESVQNPLVEREFQFGQAILKYRVCLSCTKPSRFSGKKDGGGKHG